MNMAEWGEEGLIKAVRQAFPSPAGVVGIGDDCAVVPKDDRDVWLITTDTLVEGVHFVKSWTTPQDLGYKAIAVNISDVAAMGGRARYCLASVSLPSSTERSWVEGVISGIKEAVEASGITVLGGNTTGSPKDIVISVTMWGEAPQQCVKMRNAAVPGDIVCVSGTLGSAAGALRLLKENETSIDPQLLQALSRPQAHWREGAWLGEHDGVHAMIDVSDGLYRDLGHILSASHCGARIDIEKLPIAKSLREACSKHGWDTQMLAASGGEDYRLLFTVAPESIAQLLTDYQKAFGRAFHPIGEITQGKEFHLLRRDQRINLNGSSFDHFINS